MEIVGDIVRRRVAVTARRVKERLAKAIGRAGSHRTALVSGQIVDLDHQAMSTIVHRDFQPVARVHEQVQVWIRGESIDGCEERARWRLRLATDGEEREVHRLLTCCRQASPAIERSRNRIDRKTVDIEGRAPLGGVTATAKRPCYPTGRIE